MHSQISRYRDKSTTDRPTHPVTQNWRGCPLVSHELGVNLIANTTTAIGLKVHAGLDARAYPTGIKVSDKELATVNLYRDDCHGEWNYTIHPSSQKSG